MDRVDLSFLQFQILLELEILLRVRNISLLSEHYIQKLLSKGYLSIREKYFVEFYSKMV